jgi:hypothetical protein
VVRGSKNMSSPQDILMPNGRPIGTPGSKSTIREVPGDETAAEDLFKNLAVGGSPIAKPKYPGKTVTLPGGGFVGLRPNSRVDHPRLTLIFRGSRLRKSNLCHEELNKCKQLNH